MDVAMQGLMGRRKFRQGCPPGRRWKAFPVLQNRADADIPQRERAVPGREPGSP